MKNIHITEEQLNYIKNKITEQDSYNIDLTKNIEDAGGNAKTAISNFSSSNPQQGTDLKSGKATATFNPEAVVAEEVGEARNTFRPWWDKSRPEYGDIDYDYSKDENYEEMLIALGDIARDPRYQGIFYNALETGRNEDVHELLDLINNMCGFNIHPNALRQAMRDYYEEEPYNNVMEGKLYTKKQVKEAKLANLKKNCKVIKKKDI